MNGDGGTGGAGPAPRPDGRNAGRRPRPGGPRWLFLRQWLARLALLWERLLPSLWPAMAVAGVFAAAALFDLFPRLGPWAHALLLAAFGVSFAVALWRAFSSLAFPSAAEARRRLEEASGLAHRPLEALADRPATRLSDGSAPGRIDDESQALWRLHQARMRTAAGNLRVGLPAAGLARVDPMGLRVALALVLVIALAAARGGVPDRLARALGPDFGGYGQGADAFFDAWITPPEYTGLPPVFLPLPEAAGEGGTGEREADASVPDGSVFLARIHGGAGLPELKLDDRVIPFSRMDAGNYKVSAKVTADSGPARRLALVQGNDELAAWDLDVVPDAAPEIFFAEPPGHSRRLALRIDFEAFDDYGLEGISAEISLSGGAGRDGGDAAAASDGGAGDGKESLIEIALGLPGYRPKEARDTVYRDLTAHPWAGLPVTIRLKAVDTAGQTAYGDAVPATLPERVFRHPVARAIIMLRRNLVRDPLSRSAVAKALGRIASAPSAFGDDIVVFLGLMSARVRLIRDRSDGALPSVQSLLWDLALRLEDGGMSLAERELRAAQNDLLEALSGDAPGDEIEKLMDRLQAALDNYLGVLAESWRGGEYGDENGTGRQRMVHSGDLRNALERAREMARTGARRAAREMLSRLQDVLENMRTDRPYRDSTASMEKVLGDLEDIQRQQERLLDRSFQKFRGEGSVRPSDPGGGSPERRASGDAGWDTEEAARAQEELRRRLGELMLRLGARLDDIPTPLGQAERAMHGAVDALGGNLPGRAVDHQSWALDGLRRGTRAVTEAFLRRLESEARSGKGRRPGGPPGGERDPLGRPLQGPLGTDTGDVHIPDEMEVKKAREILDELRRRANQGHRPPEERAYIERLIPRF